MNVKKTETLTQGYFTQKIKDNITCSKKEIKINSKINK